MATDRLPDLTAWTPDDFSAAANLGTFALAAAALVIATRQLRQARDLRQEEAAPYIVLDVLRSVTSSWLFELVVENVGQTAASDVRIVIDPPLTSTLDGENFAVGHWSVLTDGVRTMAPGRRLTTLFDSGHQRHAADLPRRYEATVTYADSRGRPQDPQSFTLDLEPLYGAMYTEERGVHHLVKEVEKLRKAADKIAKQVGTVEVYDGLQRDAERREAHKEWQRRVRAFEERQGRPLSEPDPDAPDAETGAGEPGVL